jgi:iron complex transport system substrate-binding protein
LKLLGAIGNRVGRQRFSDQRRACPDKSRRSNALSLRERVGVRGRCYQPFAGFRSLSFFVLMLLFLACNSREPGAQTAAPSRPLRRIVTLAPNLTEIVYALGAGDSVLGTDDYSDYPAAAKLKAKLGGVVPNVEGIAALRPDLVLVSSSAASPPLRSALERLKVRYAVIATDRAAHIPLAMQHIGMLIGLSAADAARARAQLEAALEHQTRHRQSGIRVLFVVYADPLHVAGHETFAGDIIELCGAENAATVKGWPQYSMEALLANPPDIVLHPDKSVPHEQVMALFAKAARQPEVLAVDENIFSRPGPRIVDAAAMLNATLDTWEKRGLIREPLPPRRD